MKPIPAEYADVPVRLVRALAVAFALVLLAGIAWATAASNVSAGLRYLAGDRWGFVTLLDVYAGALVVALWMRVCARRTAAWLLWVVALLCLGHVVSLVYLLVRAARARTLREVFTAQTDSSQPNVA